tara:strand:- start:9458 stop:10297 length:840 start_codon:yes stop_codon:yes gene_type:complete
MKIKKVLSAVKHKYFFKDRNLEFSSLCGISLNLIKGTIRKEADQDDAWFFQLAKHNTIIFDIGANVGYTALLALIQNPDRRYIMVDPNPLALADAGKNMMLNNLGNNISYFPAFVSDSNGDKVKFYTVGSGAAGSMYKSHAETAAILNTYSYVKTVTLDFLYNYYKLKPHLIKIDVEGAENYVLEGAIELATKIKPMFFVEMHSNKEMTMEQNAKKVLNWCKKVSYNAWYLKTGKELINYVAIAKRGKCHLLLIPKDTNFPEYLKQIKQRASLPLNLDN